MSQFDNHLQYFDHFCHRSQPVSRPYRVCSNSSKALRLNGAQEGWEMRPFQDAYCSAEHRAASKTEASSPPHRCSLDRRKGDVLLSCQSRSQHRVCSRRQCQHRINFNFMLIALLLAAFLCQPVTAVHLVGDAQDRAFEDLSILARAGKIITVAMSDAASAITAAKPSAPVAHKRMKDVANKQVQVPSSRSFMPCSSPAWVAYSMLNTCLTKYTIEQEIEREEEHNSGELCVIF